MYEKHSRVYIFFLKLLTGGYILFCLRDGGVEVEVEVEYYFFLCGDVEFEVQFEYEFFSWR